MQKDGSFSHVAEELQTKKTQKYKIKKIARNLEEKLETDILHHQKNNGI
jgi:hypothetical protein